MSIRLLIELCHVNKFGVEGVLFMQMVQTRTAYLIPCSGVFGEVCVHFGIL